MSRHLFSLRTKLILLGLIAGLYSKEVYSQVKYPYRFNPEQGIVKPVEKPFRQEICLNGRWDICPIYSTDTSQVAVPESIQWDSHKIKIPSPWNVNGFTGDTNADFVAYPSYPKKWQRAMQAWLKRDFTIPGNWRKGHRLILHFEAVAGKAIYYLNGKKIGENFDIFFPYELDITDKLRYGQKNQLLVHVLAPKLFDHQNTYGRRPYVSGSFWGTFIRGVWQDVYLLSRPAVNIEQVFIQPEVIKHQLVVNVNLRNQSDALQKIVLTGEVHRWKNEQQRAVDRRDFMRQAPQERSDFGPHKELEITKNGVIELPPGASREVQLVSKVSPGQLALWSPDNPALHVMLLNMSVNGQMLDRKYQRFGWRQYQIKKDTLLLNDRPIKLRGDSWHFMGVPQMTRRYAWAWYTVLKKANANAVRLHAEPFPSFYLDLADEMGICVLDESGIWASDGGPDYGSAAYWSNCIKHLGHLVKRDRNHASVFGWSVCNETIPVARNVFHAPDSLVRHLVDQINTWVKEVKALDPTRPWISGDGETDVPTDLPTVVGHYGDKAAMKIWANKGKPWGIGEQSMAYYGTPKQVAAINGSRAYVSQEGRMEGLAAQGYQLLRTQQSLNATYSSVFNIVWYGLKPLTLGMNDITRPAILTDGVFFSHFKEGEPGMQPERLGPYTTTLNPGYDPKLPLFDPWPFFKAIKGANGVATQSNGISTEKMDSIWQRPILKAQPATGGINKEANHREYSDVKTYYLSDNTFPLFRTLHHLGIQMDHLVRLPSKIDHKTLILIDGVHPPQGADSLAFIKMAENEGANLLVLGIDSNSLKPLDKLLPKPVTLTAREAGSLIVLARDSLLNGLDNGDFYFSEISKEPIMKTGLAGDFVKVGKVLLAACQTNWATWNGRPEYNKTANVLKSERESKPSGDILVRMKTGSGNIYLFGCSPADANGAMNGIITRMLHNLGAGFGKEGVRERLPLNPDGTIQAALYCGRFKSSRKGVEDIMNKDFIDPSILKNPGLDQKADDHIWRAAFGSSDNEAFDFTELAAEGPVNNAVAYLSFWVYSPRSLSDLLAEPDMPAVGLEIETNDVLTVTLNGEGIAQHIPQPSLPLNIPHLKLKKGMNHILLKSIHSDGQWKVKVKFKSDYPDFLKSLSTAMENL